MITAPFEGVQLVEYQDRFELRPYFWVRRFFGLGQISANRLPRGDDAISRSMLKAQGKTPLWVVAVWIQTEDGQIEEEHLEYLDPAATEHDAKQALRSQMNFSETPHSDLATLAACLKAKDGSPAAFEDLEIPHPITEKSRSIEQEEIYQARLRVLAGMTPETVALLKQAASAPDQPSREKLEREALGAYFAELANTWTEDEVTEWQKQNPVGTKWLLHFAQVFKEPEKQIDTINEELALNWLRRKYNLLTAEELSDVILVATGQRLAPGTLKKRRERLGLTTKRPTGPRPNFEP